MQKHWTAYIDGANTIPSLKAAFAEALTCKDVSSMAAFSQTDLSQVQHDLHVERIRAGISQPEGCFDVKNIATNEAYAVVRFMRDQCKVIKPSKALAEMCCQMEVNMPVKDICFPFSAFYVELPQDFRIWVSGSGTDKACVQGLYMIRDTGATLEKAKALYKIHRAVRIGGQFVEANSPMGLGLQRLGAKIETIDDMLANIGTEIVTVFAVTRDMLGETYDDFTFRVFAIDWNTDDERTAEETFLDMYGREAKHDSCKPPVEKILTKPAVLDDDNKLLFRLAANLLLYMSTPEADTITHEHSDRKTWEAVKNNPDHYKHDKIKERMSRGVCTDVLEIGRTVTIDRKNAQDAKDSGDLAADADVRTVKTHWRRGHWHRYWVGRDKSPDRRLVPKMLKPVLVIGVGSVPQQTLYAVK